MGYLDIPRVGPSLGAAYTGTRYIIDDYISELYWKDVRVFFFDLLATMTVWRRKLCSPRSIVAFSATACVRMTPRRVVQPIGL